MSGPLSFHFDHQEFPLGNAMFVDGAAKLLNVGENVEAIKALNLDPTVSNLSGLEDPSDASTAGKSDAQLQSAFDTFNQLSIQLAHSYQLLEAQVNDLTQELQSVHQQKEEELQQKQQLANRLESLINFLPGGVVVLDHHGMIVDSNPTAEKMLEPSLKGQLWRDIVLRCFTPKEDDGHEVSSRHGKRMSIATRSLGIDGQIILLTDQTETRRLQSELSRHERLTALGKMVSTLAHQVRTPLSSAMLYGNHLLNESLSSEKQHEFTGKLVNRLNEMERQVSDMLLFVRGDIPCQDRISIVDLQQQISESIEMTLQHHDIQCVWNVVQPKVYIVCNQEALAGAVLNLVNNSIQAMPDGGLLTISLKAEKEQLEIKVCDTGIGIPEAIKNHIDELFYTTKSQGTGIGLSVVNTVAKSHGGKLTLNANAPTGVCASLALPIVDSRVDDHNGFTNN